MFMAGWSVSSGSPETGATVVRTSKEPRRAADRSEWPVSEFMRGFTVCRPTIGAAPVPQRHPGCYRAAVHSSTSDLRSLTSASTHPDPGETVVQNASPLVAAAGDGSCVSSSSRSSPACRPEWSCPGWRRWRHGWPSIAPQDSSHRSGGFTGLPGGGGVVEVDMAIAAAHLERRGQCQGHDGSRLPRSVPAADGRHAPAV